MKPSLRLRHTDDPVFAVKYPATEADIVRLRDELKEHFSGHRSIIVRANDLTVFPIPRPRIRIYHPSLVAHGGRA